MLIKPFVTKPKVSINSLPLKSEDSRSNYHPAYFGTDDENTESIEFEGRLLMLPIMYKEWNVKQNKIIHDNTCSINWAICECQFAKKIRIEDLR